MKTKHTQNIITACREKAGPNETARYTKPNKKTQDDYKDKARQDKRRRAQLQKVPTTITRTKQDQKNGKDKTRQHNEKDQTTQETHTVTDQTRDDNQTPNKTRPNKDTFKFITKILVSSFKCLPYP